MIRAPRMRPLATATRVLNPDTSLVTKPSAMAGCISSIAVWASSSVASSTSSESEALAMAASTEALIWSVCSVTPWTVAMTTPVATASRPSTTRPAAAVGLSGDA